MQGDEREVSVHEVLAVARAMESSAAELYQSAAHATSVEGVRLALEGLAEMEREHERLFGEMEGSVPEEMPEDADRRGAELLAAWLDEVLFDPQGAAPTPGGDLEEWIATAVGLEKESVAFYSGLREMVRGDHRQVLDRIIEEELRHMVTLSGLLRHLRRGRS